MDRSKARNIPGPTCIIQIPSHLPSAGPVVRWRRHIGLVARSRLVPGVVTPGVDPLVSRARARRGMEQDGSDLHRQRIDVDARFVVGPGTDLLQLVMRRCAREWANAPAGGGRGGVSRTLLGIVVIRCGGGGSGRRRHYRESVGRGGGGRAHHRVRRVIGRSIDAVELELADSDWTWVRAGAESLPAAVMDDGQYDEDYDDNPSSGRASND